MQIKFLVLANAMFILASDVPWSNNHQFYEDDHVSTYSENISKSMINRDNEVTSQPRKFKRDDSAVIQHVRRKKEFDDPTDLSKESNRIQFQVEGHEGPKTYIFGFDTGYGKNRQYRLEEKHQDGTVKGQYGYYDATGKLRTVRYIARPFEGYTEIHHQSNSRKMENQISKHF